VAKQALVSAFLTFCCFQIAAGPTTSTGAEPAGPDRATVEDMLFLAGEHPVVVRVHMLIDGAGIAALQRVYSDYMFRRLDKDQNQTLDETEARRAKAIGAWAKEGNALGDRWTQLDTQPQDGVVSADEFARYFSEAVGRPFTLTTSPQRAAQSVRLFARLDVDGNGRLAQSELKQAFRTLRKLDLDDDETFSIEELQPYPEPLQPEEGRMDGDGVAGQLFVPLDGESPLEAIAQEVLLRFDGSSNGSRDNRLDSQEAAIPQDVLNRFDADGDGGLGEEELIGFLRDPVPHVELEVHLPKRRRGRPGVKILADHSTADPQTRRRPERSVAMGWGGSNVEVRATAANVATSDATNFYKVQLLMADGDKNRYLDESEFGGLNLPGANFAAVDGDADGKIYAEEVTAYVQQDAILTQSQVVMFVGRDGTTLFEILDTNKDRRLTLRELGAASAAVAQHDANRDDELANYELDSRYQVTLEVGRPPLFQNQQVPNRNLARVPNPQRPMEGPLWFRKMDSNRDGDVSWREFLGPRETFDKLDTDADGLIDAAEAETAD